MEYGKGQGGFEGTREGWKEPRRGGEGHRMLERALDGWRGQEVLKRAREFISSQGDWGESESVGEVQGVL